MSIRKKLRENKLLVRMYLIFRMYRYKYWQWRDKEMNSYLKSLKIMSKADTIDYIVKNKCSMTRYGDGEFLVMGGSHNIFQKEDDRLAEKLRMVFSEPVKDLLICIPTFLTDVSPLVLSSKIFGLEYNHSSLRDTVMPYVPTNITYGDSLLTRFYMIQKDKKHVGEYVKHLKKLWDKEDLLIVEGKYTRLGVGNDLFDNAKSIKRILCPNENAFDVYDKIVEATIQNYHGELIILAVGITATALAYDFSKMGMRALDLGHIDIEYEWYRMGAKKRVPIPNKQMSEVIGGSCNSDSNDQRYLNQIIADCV